MADIAQNSPLLLRWSKHLPASDVQDPLGLSLRGSARLGASLLYCITSITPRVRYFSFVPWCILDFQKHEKGKPHAVELNEALILREHALTLGCVAHHDGNSCDGGSLVGSDKARTWFTTRQSDIADFKKLRFVQIPAYRAYFNPLVNLGVFVTNDELPADEEGENEQRTFNDIQLSELGKELAAGYGKAVDSLSVVQQIGSSERICSIKALKQLGNNGGLCEIRGVEAPDRKLLRDVLFCRKGLSEGSHVFRRHSLLLMLELCRQMALQNEAFDQTAFSNAVFYGHVEINSEVKKIEIPSCLMDIATRWRMFYFHYFAGVALEAIFSWLVSEVGTAGLSGRTLDELVHRLDDKVVESELKRIIGRELDSPFSSLTPANLLAHYGVPTGQLTDSLSKGLDETIQLSSPLSEAALEGPLWRLEHQQTGTGLALPMVMLMVALGRYRRWEQTNYGNWFAGIAREPLVILRN